MLTDRENRPLLAFALGVYALLMSLMAIASYDAPVSGASGFVMALLVWPLLLTAVFSALAWLAYAPVISRWMDSDSSLAQGAGAAVFLTGLCLITFGAIAAWCCVSTADYLGYALLAGAGCAHHAARSAHENAPPAPPFPAARLIP